MNLFELSVALGLDDSAYKQGIQTVQSDTKKTIAALSGEYSKAAKSVEILTQKYNESVAKTGKTSTETKNLKNMLSQAQAQMKATASALKTANNGMQDFGDSTKSASESMTSAMAKGQMLGSLLTSLASKAISAAKGFVQTGISYNEQIEKYTVGFTNMLGSAEAAQQAMAKIQEDAARTPFDVESLTQANQLLIGAGENAAYSEKVIMALGNAISATGGGNAELSRMAANLQQVANVGKAASIDIKQFAYAGINIYQILADYTGKTVQEVQKMTISYDVLSQALIAASEEGGRYYNAMDTQSQTMNGRIVTLQDNFKQLAGAMTGDLTNAFGQLVSKANELVVAMKDGWNADGFQGMMSAAAQTVPQLEGVANALKWIETNSNVLIPIVETLCGAFVYFKVVMGVQGAMGAITAFLNPANLLIVALGLIAGAMVTAYTKCEPFRNAFNNAFSAVETVAGNAVSWVMDKINTLIAGVAGAIAALDSLKNGEGWEAAKNAYVNAYNSNRQSQKSKQWDSDHANMEWDENDGWVPKGTASNDSGNGTSRQEDFKPKGTGSSLSGAGGTGAGAGSTSKKSVTERVDWAQQDAATSYSKNDYGQITKASTELTEHVVQSDGKQFTRLTRTITESGKEMVNGVVKNYKTVTKYVDKFDKDGKKIGDTVAQVEKVYEDASGTIDSTTKKTLTTVSNGVTTTTETTTQKMADGMEHTVEVITETGKEMVNGVSTTYTLIKKKVDGFDEEVTKTYDDMSKTLVDTSKATSTSLKDGVTETTEKTTETYADGSTHIVELVTETGERIVNGVLETYKKVKKIIDGEESDSEETTEAVVSQYDTLSSAFGAASKRVEELTALYNQSAAETGENSEQTMRLSAMLDEAEETYLSAAQAWQEYQKKTNRAYVVTKNFADFLKKSNSAFSDFGSSLSSLGEFFDSDVIQGVGDFFSEITDGVDKVINLATSTATLVTTLQELSNTLKTMNATGGISSLVSGIGKLFGIGGTAAATGAAAGGTAAAAGGTAAAGAAGATGLAALGITIPELGLIIAGILGVAAVGYGIYKFFTKDNGKSNADKKLTYTDIQDAYWYGNERAFAGYDYRTDPYTFNPNNSAVLAYQTKMQEQLARLTDVVQQYLPDVANQQIVLDDGTLVGCMATGMNEQLGQLQVLSERGN